MSSRNRVKCFKRTSGAAYHEGLPLQLAKLQFGIDYGKISPQSSEIDSFLVGTTLRIQVLRNEVPNLTPFSGLAPGQFHKLRTIETVHLRIVIWDPLAQQSMRCCCPIARAHSWQGDRHQIRPLQIKATVVHPLQDPSTSAHIHKPFVRLDGAAKLIHD